MADRLPARVQADLERQFMAVIDLVPDLAERVRAGRRAERFSGAANLPNFLRRPYGPGWALVGDAGCHKDPYLALGICDAFRDAELLVDAIDQGLTGPPARRSDGGLRAAAQRSDDCGLSHEPGSRAVHSASAEQQRLQAALRGNQEATNQFFMAREG